MNSKYTHFSIENSEVDLLAGDVTACLHCGRPIFRDHAFISDEDPETAGEPTTVSAHLAMGRQELPPDAHRVDEGHQYCDSCDPEDKKPEGHA